MFDFLMFAPFFGLVGNGPKGQFLLPFQHKKMNFFIFEKKIGLVGKVSIFHVFVIFLKFELTKDLEIFLKFS
jgi:hypothetical protein